MQYILITGASQGIGYATALRLARQGHQVWALARRAEPLLRLAHEAGPNLHPLVYDLQQTDHGALAEQLAQQMPQLDVLINNAGQLLNQAFAHTRYEQLWPMLQTNVVAVGLLTRDLLPLLARSSAAHVVNVSSMGGFQGSAKFPGLSWYSASKAAVVALTEALAEELKPEHIAVNCLALGAVQTEMLEAAFPGYRAPLQADDMAEFMAHFACTGHRFFNGKVLPVSVSTP